ncbi:hypothetical protein X975_15013, partial [Stegodyphus mimosarum]
MHRIDISWFPLEKSSIKASLIHFAMIKPIFPSLIYILKSIKPNNNKISSDLVFLGFFLGLFRVLVQEMHHTNHINICFLVRVEFITV